MKNSRALISFVMSLVLMLLLGSASLVPRQSWHWGLAPANAQRVRLDDAWRSVYQQLPDFPKENQYISTETGKAATDNTLVGRLIRYHIYVKERSPIYRFDWKLTLADYLDVNEWIDENTYPSAKTLRTNPMEGDVAVIRKLNRSQREALVQALIDAFSSLRSPATQPGAMTSPSPALSTPASPATPARSGGASDLLSP
jgi:hypothetical protein